MEFECLEHIASLDVGFGEITAQFDGLIVIGNRLVMSAEVLQRAAAIIIGNGIVWSERDGFVEAGKRFVRASQSVERIADASGGAARSVLPDDLSSGCRLMGP